MTTGIRRSIARSIARVIFSPTTTPMLPPMKPYSIAATLLSMASIRPVAQTTASSRPVEEAPAFSRCVYGFVSMKLSGSVERRRESCSSQSPSNSRRSRSTDPTRKWCAHLGQT